MASGFKTRISSNCNPIGRVPATSDSDLAFKVYYAGAWCPHGPEARDMAIDIIHEYFPGTQVEWEVSADESLWKRHTFRRERPNLCIFRSIAHRSRTKSHHDGGWNNIGWRNRYIHSARHVGWLPRPWRRPVEGCFEEVPGRTFIMDPSKAKYKEEEPTRWKRRFRTDRLNDGWEVVMI